MSGALKKSVGLGKVVNRDRLYELLDMKKPEKQAEEVADRVSKKLEKIFPEFAQMAKKNIVAEAVTCKSTVVCQQIADTYCESQRFCRHRTTVGHLLMRSK